jgi:xylan 1,4-beta-xylosidase
LISREGIHKPSYNVFNFLSQLGDESVALTLGGDAAGVGGIATRDAAGGTALLLYNAQAPGAGPPNGPYYAVAQERVITIQLSGLAATTPFDLAVYKVDETHGNAYAAWQALGRPHKSAMSVEDWTKLRLAMDSAPIDQEQALCGSSLTRTVKLSSPGVLLLTLKPSQPRP